jgi:molybdopterin converting factor small subunit
MKIKLIAFGIAKDILENRILELEIVEKATIANLKTQLIETYPTFSKLASLSFAVNETYQADDFLLSENQEVVIIPPVAGG